MALKHLPDLLDYAEFEDSAQVLVCTVMYYRADRRGVIWCPQNEIAAECRLSRSTVARTIRRLLELGLLDYLGHGRYGLPKSGNHGKPSETPKLIDENVTEAKDVFAYIRQEWDGEPKIIVVVDEEPAPPWLVAARKSKLITSAGPQMIGDKAAWAYDVHWPSP